CAREYYSGTNYYFDFW
nr:immunoglobulin heavy chain junction region [Mus musculus]MBK4195432.1 immunoglobulin heavy chain junction region [Mus musculus]